MIVICSESKVATIRVQAQDKGVHRNWIIMMHVVIVTFAECKTTRESVLDISITLLLEHAQMFLST